MKKSYKYFLLLFFVSTIYSAQTYRFYYELNFKKDIRSEERFRELMVLDINEHETKFYAHRLLKADSLLNLDNIYELIGSGKVEIYPNFKEKLKRKTGGNINTSYYSPSISTYYAVKTKDIQNWQIFNNEKVIEGFKAKEARVNYGGRSWTAWFTDEISFTEGPHKFRGLPGLILELKDSDGEYHFTFVGNEKINNKVDTSFFLETDFNHRKPIEISEDKFIKIQKEYFVHPFKDLGERKMYIEKEGERKEIDMKDKIKQAQERMLKESNFVEKNKILNFTS